VADSAFRTSGGPARRGKSPGHVVHLDRDRALVEAAQRDPAAFDALYRRYLAQVYSFVYYELGHHADAEDVTERVFMQALVGLPRFEERGGAPDGGESDASSTFRVWLFQIARNAVMSEHRARRRRPTTSLDLLDDAVDETPAADPARQAIVRASASDALAAVADLPADRRRALLLRFVDQMSTAEIAAVLGRSEGAVRVLIHRGLRSVARRLDRDGSDRPRVADAPTTDR
jgi:RNA polymerase sigma-70 factor, ECF subfamily